VPVHEGKRGKRKGLDRDPGHSGANDSGGSEREELGQDVPDVNQHLLDREWQTVANVDQQDVSDDE
jgi:hypothetical protein